VAVLSLFGLFISGLSLFGVSSGLLDFGCFLNFGGFFSFNWLLDVGLFFRVNWGFFVGWLSSCSGFSYWLGFFLSGNSGLFIKLLFFF
jgi:hypothetical protein